MSAVRPSPPAREAPPAQRLDSWLWYARILKTRSRAAAFIAGGAVRLTRAGVTTRVIKPATPVQAGDILTFMHGHSVRRIRILDLAARRGPASAAAGLYEHLDVPEDRQAEALTPKS